MFTHAHNKKYIKRQTCVLYKQYTNISIYNYNTQRKGQQVLKCPNRANGTKENFYKIVIEFILWCSPIGGHEVCPQEW